MEAFDMQKVFDASPEATALLSAEGVLLGCNQRFERTLGSASMLKGIDFFQNSVHPEEHTRFRLAIRRAIENYKKGDVQEEVVEDASSEGDASDMKEWMRVPVVRSCLTLALGTKGDFPVWRRLDWALSCLDENTVSCTARLEKIRSEKQEEEKKDSAPSERELLDFLNKAPIAMHWLSGTGHVLWANETEMNTLGYTAEEYIGQPIMNFCPDETPKVLEIFKTLGSGNSIQDTPVRFRTKGGEIKDLLIDSNVNWNPDGSFKHTRCFIRDDTARKVREARLTVAQEKDREMLHGKDIFFRKIFHEIRTPTHLLANTSEALDEWVEKRGDAEGRLLMERQRTHIAQLRTMVEDAADASLFNLGRVPVLRPAGFNLRSLLASLAADLAPSLKPSNKGVVTLSSGARRQTANWGSNLLLDLSPDVDSPCIPANFIGDEKVIKRVLRHLLVLGMDRCKPDHADQVEVKATFWPPSDTQPARISFSVSDTGEGVDEKEISQSFHNYFHSASSALDAEAPPARKGADLTKDSRMAVLGLYVSFNLVQVLGGTLSCSASPQSAQAAGSNTFTFTVPLQPASEQPRANLQDQFDHLIMRRLSRDSSTGASSSGDSSVGSWTDMLSSAVENNVVEPDGMKVSAQPQAPAVGIAVEMKRTPSVLLADRSSVTQKVVGAMLKKLNCVVEAVGDGAELMRRLEGNADCYDLVILEPNLPIVDGFEVTKRMAAHPLMSRVPIIALVTKSELADGVAGSFPGTLEKPLKKDALQEAILGLCGRREATPSSSLVEDEESFFNRRFSVSSQETADASRAWRCLIIEDDRVCQKVAVKMMTKLGFECETADNGLQGLNMLRQDPDRAQLVLMDLRMPVMDGLEATRLIRDDPRMAGLQVVALTSELIDSSWSEGFSGMLNKPTTVKVLGSEVERLFPTYVRVASDNQRE
mmetsp:Transcript_60951/g.143523  ORF Transcript_60951/g.143523 Transcript_60951/m.143523 type:complete len:933 (-) Transcript_60951:410-3208(-)